MDGMCHRCGGDLSVEPGARFCPHCGAPQLRLSSAVVAEASASSSDSTGTEPPPRAREIEWRTALGSALFVAGIAALLFLVAAVLPLLSFPALLWAGAGSLLTVEIYAWRTRGARMNGAIGARIGASAGVLMVGALGTALALAGVVARFALHRMGNFDRQLRQSMAEQIDAAVKANPAAAPLLSQSMLPGVIAGSMLVGFLIAAAFLFAVSVAGGALGGTMRQRRTSS